MKVKIFLFFCGLLGVGIGQIPPGWLTWLFFPLQKYACNYANVRYDFQSRTYTISGVEISEHFFKVLSKSGIPEGSCILLTQKGRKLYAERRDYHWLTKKQ